CLDRATRARRGAVTALAAAALIAAGCGSDAAAGDDTAASDAADTVGATVDSAGEDTGEADAAQDTVSACPEGTVCDDGDPCTENDQCDAGGACLGTAVSCDDGLSCTVDSCQSDGSCAHSRVAGFCLTEGEAPACVAHNGPDPQNGCRVCNANQSGGPAFYTLTDGASCDDSDACTKNEVCELGQCVAKGTLDCTTDNPCVAPTCDPVLGCVTTNVDGGCDDGDPCTVGDSCADGACVAGTEALDCDDEDACTLDACVPGEGCSHDPDAVCNDHDPCTNDSCLAGGNCQNVPFTGPCEDGNPCTIGEVCDVGGTCAGGTANTCDDDNACTLDSCHPDKGCLHLFADTVCSDGADCTVDDVCVAGECFGVKTNQCPYCPVTPTTHANKIVGLELASDGFAGSGLDVDGDPSTCAPDASCSGGVDNALGVVGALLNDSVATSLEIGAMKWVIDLKDLRWDGEPFVLNVYDSGLTLASEQAQCDFQHEICEYDIAQLSFDQNCVPYFSFDNARIVNGELVAGGTNSLISMVLPLQSGSLLKITIAWARVRASFTEENGKITSLSAVIGGAIPKLQLEAAISGLKPTDLPIDKDAALGLLGFLPADIDLDGDEIEESMSLGMRINSIEAIIAE
ncbi:MAG: hypothetical protein EP329_14750, partial [Deltaproteobacteria bacterium]